jgi:hypothetical protein
MSLCPVTTTVTRLLVGEWARAQTTLIAVGSPSKPHKAHRRRERPVPPTQKVDFIALSTTPPAAAVLVHLLHPSMRLSKPKDPNKLKTFESAYVRFGHALDVEMNDATRPSTSGPRSIPISIPRTLGRPEFTEVSSEALQAVDPSLVDTDINHICETL